MKKIAKEQQQTFDDLRKPTFDLIGSFYEVPSEIKSVFADIMAVYEANPTSENAKMISDKIMGRGSVEEKKKWVKGAVASVPQEVRDAAKIKYIDEQQAVPKGIPTSGMLLVGLNVVSKKEKDILMEAQAAARLIAHVDLLDKYEPKTNYQKAEGVFENDFLDKPFATKIQRLEHVVNAVVNDIHTKVAEDPEKFAGMKISLGTMNFEQTKESVIENICQNNLFLQKARNESLKVLYLAAEHIKLEKLKMAKELKEMGNIVEAERQQNSVVEISDRIIQMANALDVYKNIGAKLEKAREERFASLIEMIHSPERNAVERIHNAKIKQLELARRAKSPLGTVDFINLKRAVAGRPIEGLIKHRVSQILSDPARQVILAKDKARG